MYLSHIFNMYNCIIRKITASAVLLCMIVVLSSCEHPVEPTVVEGFFFDTFVTVTIYDSCDSTVTDGCIALCDRYENLLSKNIPGSDIYRLNHADGESVTVSTSTLQLLREACRYAELTDGAIDPTIESINSLWDFHQTESSGVPDEEIIQNALQHVNYRNISFDGSLITISDPEAEIDLGFIAKGYIADRLKEYLLSKDIHNALINLGGNIVVMGLKPSNEPFLVAVEKPFENGVPMAAFSVTDCSLVTSGVYHRYFYEGDNFYHHILDARTGYPVNNGLYSVSILGESSMTCDALSTTCFVLGAEAGMELIESTDGVEAMFIMEDLSIRYSSGFPIPVSIPSESF